VTIRIGTSGWHYESWLGGFYPAALASGDMLAFYARTFETVEVNSSFYRLPSDDTLRAWTKATPDGFVFAFKASRYLTHRKKLIDPEEPLQRVLSSAGLLHVKLGPILFQLPPRWHLNLERFRSFVALLPKDRRFVFEFRDRSWFAEPVYQVLRESRVGFCMYDFAGIQSPLEVTADFVYIRLHGPSGRYSGLYQDEALTAWARRIAAWEGEGRDTYCYFDNDEHGFAVQNATELKRMLASEMAGRRTAPQRGTAT
jgi:uncharacterized protein YecE (DUF72 family)